jgi:hypothetical protein
MTAMPVNVLVMDAIRKTVSLVTGLYAETSAIPWLCKN